ncbi:PREDICTED: uncharacterized protein LOC107099292 [Cyprinodon variegatus]|uniref:uncharacterized protein LOC107099292 n=1 Tax=Cyprinodon variegatus TaxID=28743 RepID=UPI00074260AD|nr:PREDICTED: uncharacterized protein LOC107099292 [Cyprinodon variegatus]
MMNALLCMLVFFLLWSFISAQDDVSIKPTVTLQHNWSPIFRGETVTLRCEIHGSGGTEWTYEWITTNRTSLTSNESRTIRADSDSYSCRGKTNYEQTQWSDSFLLTVEEKPTAKLIAEETVIPAGGSITLTCSVPSSAGWQFDWFRQESLYHAAESIRNNDPDGFLSISEEDPHPAASLSVSPDRVQHFNSDSVSLSCEGNSTEWRVKWITEIGLLFDCFYIGNMNRSTCSINMDWYHSGVYWCESGSGHFSNSVNITVQGRTV